MQAMSRVLLAASAVLLAAVRVTASSPAAPIVERAHVGYATQQLPDGPGKELVAKLCAGCHDLTFTISTRETEEGWTRIVNDMRSKGADGSEEDFAKVIVYLANVHGQAGATDDVDSRPVAMTPGWVDEQRRASPVSSTLASYLSGVDEQ